MTQFETYLSVTFVIMWKLTFILFFLLSIHTYGQEHYNQCDLALELCPGKTFDVNNYGANHTFCGGCEDDFNLCFTPQNSVWFKFTTNEVGGDVNLSIFNVNLTNEATRDNKYNAIVLSSNVPCNAVSYTQVGLCIQNSTTNGTINLTNLPVNTTFYICISGALNTGFALPAEFEMELSIAGTAVDRPTPSVHAALNTNVCPGDMLYAVAGVQNCPDTSSYKWYIDGVLVATSTDSIFMTTRYNDGSILTLETSCYTQCREIVQFHSAPIQIHPITVNAGVDFTIMKGGSVILTPVIPNGTTIEWTPSFSLSNSTIAFPIAQPNQSTIYTLTITDTLTGCKAVDQMEVNVLENIIVTNTFSPNGDGVNDTWYIQGLTNYPNNEVKIYSRWGQLVYEARNFGEQKAWDGRVGGAQLQESVYFYILELNDEDSTQIKGSITLLR